MSYFDDHGSDHYFTVAAVMLIINIFVFIYLSTKTEAVIDRTESLTKQACEWATCPDGGKAVLMEKAGCVCILGEKP